tara:strand:+ start:63 stop:233 length:171 start_codon:yes stop_codon:yes gene_type:complete
MTYPDDECKTCGEEIRWGLCPECNEDEYLEREAQEYDDYTDTGEDDEPEEEEDEKK